jgi:AbrB family looped-hinge helix DNA binding protein
MRIRVSSKGQVVLPGAILRKLGLRPGDSLDASVKNGQIVLTPRHSRPAKAAVGDSALATLDQRIPSAFVIPV